ncbi:V-type proton ATPase subunit G-like isoform X2 [Durio zibethinus]|uniref:V-type proton ATPase subunit G n=1 Tax=Durio zibethinus TaxID=66656 RepID=A0A6P6ARB8_DURZI|nr:V-type proton ATPase subunit G-like isoform X2 [Durio zibethinus]
MEANRGQGGIQQLLAAEQEAQHIVNAARNAKMARLKQAKEEAEKEIAEYRAQVEKEFQRKVAEIDNEGWKLCLLIASIHSLQLLGFELWSSL